MNWNRLKGLVAHAYDSVKSILKTAVDTINSLYNLASLAESSVNYVQAAYLTNHPSEAIAAKAARDASERCALAYDNLKNSSDAVSATVIDLVEAARNTGQTITPVLDLVREGYNTLKELRTAVDVGKRALGQPA